MRPAFDRVDDDGALVDPTIRSTPGLVRVEISEAENSARLHIPDDLGFSPEGLLEDLQPPVGW